MAVSNSKENLQLKDRSSSKASKSLGWDIHAPGNITCKFLRKALRSVGGFTFKELTGMRWGNSEWPCEAW